LKILFKSSHFFSRHEQVQNDEQENHVINEDSVFPTHNLYDNTELLSTSEVKEEILSSETVIKQDNENETTPVINEYDLLNNGIDLRYIKKREKFCFFIILHLYYIVMNQLSHQIIFGKFVII